jgi:hypothetical protein
LRLSAQEMDIVREGIPADFPDAGIHLRLALGAEIPEDVQLQGFAPFVLDRVAKLRGYTFLVAGDQLVIVEPRDRKGIKRSAQFAREVAEIDLLDFGSMLSQQSLPGALRSSWRAQSILPALSASPPLVLKVG